MMNVSMRTDERTILVAGVTRIWAGITAVTRDFSQRGIRFVFYYFEMREMYTPDGGGTYQVIRAPKGRLANWMNFVRTIRTVRPAHVEIYHHHPDPVIVLGQILIARLLGVPVVTVCTGGEILYWSTHTVLKRLSVRVTLLLSKMVILKETYMQGEIVKHRLAHPAKLIFVHNGVVVGPEPVYGQRPRTVLFLNTFKTWRHVDLIILAAKRVAAIVPDVRFLLVGATGRKGEQELQALITETDVTHCVTILPFTKTPGPFFDRSSVFVLPADVVFCNNSLLEAMERGVPPIVADVPGAELIVEHGTSGLRVERTEASIAEAILLLLGDESFRLNLARGARRVAAGQYDVRERARLLAEAYERRVWPSRKASGAEPVERRFRKARIWSNAELQKIGHLFEGDVVNVSSGENKDKEGRTYDHYFPHSAGFYQTNHAPGTYRGFAARPNEFLVDLEQPLSASLTERFDVAFNHTVLEHIFDLWTAFGNLCALSRDIVILVVPFAQMQHDTPTYLDHWRFTPSALRALFKAHGMEVVYEACNDEANAAVYLFFVASRYPERWLTRMPTYTPLSGVGAWIGGDYTSIRR